MATISSSDPVKVVAECLSLDMLLKAVEVNNRNILRFDYKKQSVQELEDLLHRRTQLYLRLFAMDADIAMYYVTGSITALDSDEV